MVPPLVRHAPKNVWYETFERFLQIGPSGSLWVGAVEYVEVVTGYRRSKRSTAVRSRIFFIIAAAKVIG